MCFVVYPPASLLSFSFCLVLSANSTTYIWSGTTTAVIEKSPKCTEHRNEECSSVGTEGERSIRCVEERLGPPVQRPTSMLAVDSTQPFPSMSMFVTDSQAHFQSNSYPTKAIKYICMCCFLHHHHHHHCCCCRCCCSVLHLLQMQIFQLILCSRRATFVRSLGYSIRQSCKRFIPSTRKEYNEEFKRCLSFFPRR